MRHLTRKQFLKTVAAGIGAGIGGELLGIEATNCRAEPPLLEAAPKQTLIRRLKHPVAIAMWDFSWLLRRHRGGGFESWERVLDELMDRGYDAVRIDVFPPLLALPGRTIPEQITFKGDPSGHRLWGNDVDVTVNPREALVAFLHACQKRGVVVALSTWFCGPEAIVERRPEIQGFEGFAGVWEETLDFLERQGLMKNILFVDLLNEYPLWNGFNWLKQQAIAAGNQKPAKLDTANIHLQNNREYGLTPGGRQYYKEFSTRLLKHFRSRYPQYDFALSISVNWDSFHPETCLDVDAMDVIDAHVWFGHNSLIGPFDMGEAAKMPLAKRRELYDKLKIKWDANKGELTTWIGDSIQTYAQIGRKNNAIVGNTEGWGCVGWDDVEGLDWEFIKQSAEIAVELAIKSGYKFICTSNFTHPHFRGLWQDVQWHKQITARIKSS